MIAWIISSTYYVTGIDNRNYCGFPKETWRNAEVSEIETPMLIIKGLLLGKNLATEAEEKVHHRFFYGQRSHLNNNISNSSLNSSVQHICQQHRQD